MKRGPTWVGGWYTPARHCSSPNHGPRPEGVVVSLVVVHSISLPPGHWGGDAVERFFTNRLDAAAHPYFAGIAQQRVSAHFFIRRSGRLVQFVSCERRAWHAGVSSWQGRENCNDWSIGIELEGLEGLTFENAQYRALARLLQALARRYPLQGVLGHEHVAPARKGDPGPGFHWAKLRRAQRRAAAAGGGGGSPVLLPLKRVSAAQASTGAA
jgi:N-acetyl-anhydromuramoyl-L-alanine amidase